MPFHDIEYSAFFSHNNSTDLGISESHDEPAALEAANCMSPGEQSPIFHAYLSSPLSAYSSPRGFAVAQYSMSPMQLSDCTSVGVDLGLIDNSHVSNMNEHGHINYFGDITGECDMPLGHFADQVGLAIQVLAPEANMQNPTGSSEAVTDRHANHGMPAMELDQIEDPQINSPPTKSSSPAKGEPSAKKVGPGGARCTPAENRKKPRSQVTATRVNGVLQIEDKLTKGYLNKFGILKKHIAKNPHMHKSLGGTVHPILKVPSFKMTTDEHIAIAREIWPKTKDDKTARKNFSKLLCEITMNSDPTTSKQLGLYNVTYNEEQFAKTAFKLMTGGNPSDGRPDFHIVTAQS